MEKSEKFGFSLPSRDADDIADINQISDNFRIIDETIPSKEDIKNIQINIDQTYDPTSANAQSGKAVAEAIDKESTKYFDITLDGKISLKPEYRGAYGFKLHETDTPPIEASQVPYAVSDNGVESVGSKNHELPSELIIPDTINGIKVTSYAEGMFAYNTKLKSVILCDSTTSIPDYFLCRAYNLESVENTAAITTVGENSFAQTQLKKIELHNLGILGALAFRSCAYLVSANIGNVSEIPKGAFFQCMYLTDITILKPAVTIEAQAFMGCGSLRSIDNLVAPNITTSIGKAAFLYCRPTYDWDSLENAGCAFGENATPKQMGNYNPYTEKSRNLINPTEIKQVYATTTNFSIFEDHPLLLQAGTYTFKYFGVDAMQELTIRNRDLANDDITAVIFHSYSAKVATFTLTKATHISIYMYNGVGTNGFTEYGKDYYQLELGDTATEYVPYGTVVRFTPHSNKALSFFNQSDVRWRGEYLGGVASETKNEKTFNEGCMFFSTMGIYCSLNDIEVDNPWDLLTICEQKGINMDLYVANINKQFYKNMLDSLGLHYEVITGRLTKEKAQMIFDAIADGKYVEIGAMGGKSVSSGHAAAVTGITPNGELVIPDTSNPTWRFGDSKVINRYIPINNLIKDANFEEPNDTNVFTGSQEVYALILSKKED